MDQTPSPNNDKPMERVLYEVKKIIVGQDKLLERFLNKRPVGIVKISGSRYITPHVTSPGCTVNGIIPDCRSTGSPRLCTLQK